MRLFASTSAPWASPSIPLPATSSSKSVRKLLFFPLTLVALMSAPAFGQGTCTNFVGGACPANIPSGVTHFYFIDAVDGLDSNSGASESAAWKSVPYGSVSGAHNPASASGTGFIFKGGVTQGSTNWPANLPYGGQNGAPNYIGYDPGWYSGSAWTRPIFNGGGSGGYNSATLGMLTDQADHASYLIFDNIEMTGLWWTGTNSCSASNPVACTYLSTYQFYSGSDTNWQVENSYFHNITNCNNSTVCNDEAVDSAIVWLPNDSGSSAYNNVFDNRDGSANCCGAVYSANVYRNYINGFVGAVSNIDILTIHDNWILNPVTTFIPPPNEPHGNCLHVWGTNPSSFVELIYNNRVDCTNANAESLEMEQDYASIYIFNNVFTNDYQGNGEAVSSFSGGGYGGTYTYFQNTQECGTDSTPQGLCVELRNNATAIDYNNFGVTNDNDGGTIVENSGWTGSYTSSPNTSVTCSGITTKNYGGIQICSPVGSGNGTGNLNFTETYPFAPLDSAGADTVGKGSNRSSLCSTISGISPAAGTACLSDTTLGVGLNSTNHTVIWPARIPILRPTGTTAWHNGAYEFTNDGATLYPASINFGAVAVGNSLTGSVTLANDSDQTLTITLIATTPTVYTQTNNCSSSLAAGATCTITVTFKPKKDGSSYPGSVSAEINGTSTKVKAILSGSGD